MGQFFKSCWRLVVQTRMEPLQIVIGFNVFKNFNMGVFDIIENAAFQQFTLEPPETRFHESVVVRVAGSAHTLPEMLPGQQSPQRFSLVLSAAVRMNEHLLWWAAGVDTFFQGFHNQFFPHVCLQLPTHDPS